MSRYEFSIASAEDDDALKQRMARDIMPGLIPVSFRRSPDYFAGSALQGEHTQVIKCTDKSNNAIVGLGTRATLSTYVNGDKCTTGYLCDLRGDEKARGGTLLARGYRFLRQLHNQQPLPVYYSMVLDGNETAISLLTSGRGKLPAYTALGKFNTPAILLGAPRKFTPDTSITIEKAGQEDIATLTTFINNCNRRFQFAPVIAPGDFTSGRLAGLNIDDIYIAKSGSEVIATASCWDQQSIRQIHVEQYSTALRAVRPLYNVLSKFLSFKPLPEPGQSLSCFYLSLVAVRDDDPAVFRQLLEHIYSERRTGPWQMFFTGFHERHPFNEVTQSFRQIAAAGQLFSVHWPDDTTTQIIPDDRIPHLEAGAL